MKISESYQSKILWLNEKCEWQLKSGKWNSLYWKRQDRTAISDRVEQSQEPGNREPGKII